MPLSDRVSRDEIVALASRLIAIPSTSGEERAIMEDVARWCDEAGLSAANRSPGTPIART